MREDNLELVEYDLKGVYREEIIPRIEEIKKICRKNKIPFFCSFAVANNEKKTVYENDGNLTGSTDIKLYDDLFKKMLLVLNGAEVRSLGSISANDDIMDYISDDGDD